MQKTIRLILTQLVAYEIWVISAGIFLSILLPSTLLGVVCIGILYWLIRKFSGGQFSDRTPVDIGVLSLLLLVPLNLWATAIPVKTIPQVLRLLSGIVFMYSIVNWARTSNRIRWIVYSAVIATFLLGLFSTVSVEWTREKLLFIPAAIYDRLKVLVSDTVHRNVMAGFLVILFPLTLGLLIFAWKELRRWNRLGLVIVAIVVFVILILTQSRGALLATCAVLGLMIVLRWRWGWIAIPAAVIALGATIAYLGVNTFLGFLGSGVSLAGVDGRLEVWSRAIYMIQDFPISGVGLGLFGDVADNLYPFFLNSPGSVPHAHNLFLQIAVDMGIPGLIAWLSILFIVIILSWQIYQYGRHRQDRYAAGLGAGLLGSQVALIVHGFLDAATWGGVRPAPIVWAIWGLACAAWLYYHKRMA